MTGPSCPDVEPALVRRYTPATEDDLPALAALYREAARTMGPRVYTPAQVDAWVRVPDDAVAFRAWVLEADTEIALDAADTPLGFCGIDAAGHVHSLYVRPDAHRHGIATRLLARALARARSKGITALDAWATPFSQVVFMRQGFAWSETVQGLFGGERFERYRMTR